MAAVMLGKRAQVREMATGRQRRWSVQGSAAQLVELRSALGLPRRWLVVEPAGQGERVAARKRTRAAALRFLQQLVARG